MLKDKRIIFSCDGIVGYKESLEKVLKKEFLECFYLEEDMLPKEKRNLQFKILREINKKLPNIYFLEKNFKKILKKHYDAILENYGNEIDYFFVVAGREFSLEFLEELKKRNPKIKCILFLWDKYETTSLKKNSNKFDYIFTFDKNDAKKYNFIFQPSFYIDFCNENRIDFSKRKYSVYYIGALRDEKRYFIVKYLSDLLKKNNQEFFLKLFVTKKNKRYLPLNYTKNLILENKIKYLENVKLLKNSKVVLDLNHKSQIGLTLRVFESIATNTKIITTNKDIINYDFYSKERIEIISSEEDIKNINKFFYESPVKELSEKIKKRYSAEGFIKEIFEYIQKERV